MDDYYTQYPRGELPTVEDTAQILQNQKGFMQQLQIENKYVKVFWDTNAQLRSVKNKTNV